uniref:6-cysteine protein n=1 Tax=Strongyloides stercoralis TaxID=6248 RepID=A0A0K0EKL1_STRER
MFLHYRYSIVVWLLLQFLVHTEQKHLGDFPAIHYKPSLGIFPLKYHVDSMSEIVLLKCPGVRYQNTTERDYIMMNKDIEKEGLLHRTENDSFFWVPIFYNSTGITSLNCGKFAVYESFSNPNISLVDFSFDVSWNRVVDIEKVFEGGKVTTKLPTESDKCNFKENKVIVYHKTGKNNFTKIGINDKVLGRLNQMYYYFDIPDEANQTGIMDPCVAIKAINEIPEIIMQHKNLWFAHFAEVQIFVVKKQSVSEPHLVQLKINAEPLDFYEGENLKKKKMKLTLTGVEEIPNTEEVVPQSSPLFSSEFELLEYSYDCPTKNGTTKVKRIFYFGPDTEKSVFSDENVMYYSNDSKTQPNCDVDKITFGYLNSVNINGVTHNLTKINGNGTEEFNPKGVEEFITTLIVKNEDITLDCNYKTPGGSVTFVRKFLSKNKAPVKPSEKENSGEKNINEKNIGEKNKKLPEASKELPKEVKNNDKSSGPSKTVVGIIVAVVIIMLIVFIVCFIKFVLPRIVMLKTKKQYPNVVAFWNELSLADFDKYFDIIKDNRYTPDILKQGKFSNKKESFDVDEMEVKPLFDKSLVKCTKIINGEIKAHYINDISPARTYIISDGPEPEKMQYFWELLYHEDVKVVIAFVYEREDFFSNKYNKYYWPQDKETYGKVTVEFLEKEQTNLSFIAINRFKLTLNNGESKELKIFHARNWREYNVPCSDFDFISLYKEVSECSKGGNVLLHSSQGTGSCVFIYTYFACIFEVMKDDKSVENPMDVIKKVREKRYEENMGTLEYAFIIKNLVLYFFDQKMLVDGIKFEGIFNKKIQTYIYNLENKKPITNTDIETFTKFANTLDSKKFTSLCENFSKVEVLSNEDLQKRCSRFYAVSQLKNIKKIRDPNIPCLDLTSVSIKGKTSKDTDGFIHANMMTYKYKGKKERKIIMCQGPFKETIDDMFDMFFRYDVRTIVVLVTPEEMFELNQCYPYLHTSADEVPTGSYSTVHKDHHFDRNNCVTEYDFAIINSQRKGFNVKIFHYISWPDKSIPSENQSIYGLYGKIMAADDGHCIAIHCNNGTGRTGTLALIIYMMDLIASNRPFDPIKCLTDVRKHRYGAVETSSQFVFALSIVYEHFKDKLDDAKSKAYDKFMDLAEVVFKKEKKK